MDLVSARDHNISLHLKQVVFFECQYALGFVLCFEFRDFKFLLRQVALFLFFIVGRDVCHPVCRE